MAMTANDFRRLALALPETEERAHMDHPDFRVGGKSFATLGYPHTSRGMVKLSLEERHSFTKNHAEIFVPVKGARGRNSATFVHLELVKKETLQEALQAAWRNIASKSLREHSRQTKAASKTTARKSSSQKARRVNSLLKNPAASI